MWMFVEHLIKTLGADMKEYILPVMFGTVSGAAAECICKEIVIGASAPFAHIACFSQGNRHTIYPPSESDKVVKHETKMIRRDAVCMPMSAEPSVINFFFFEDLLDLVEKLLR